jgi:hypothetical protein
MGEVHSFVSFFASFFLKKRIDIVLQKAYQHCILLNKSFVMKRVCLSLFCWKEAVAGSAAEQPARNISSHRCILVL